MTAIDPKNRYKYELTYVTETNIAQGLPDKETKEFEIELIHGDEFEKVLYLACVVWGGGACTLLSDLPSLSAALQFCL